MRQYISRSVGKFPRSNSVSISRSMRSNRSSGTKPELLLSKMLRKKILSNNFPGRPDFVYLKKKIAIFVHGCFWHRCPQCNFNLPKRNRDFWARKFTRNMERDLLVKGELEHIGWKIIEIWEHELKKNPKEVAKRIIKFVNDSP